MSFPLGKLPCHFIWKIIKMKHGDFLCSSGFGKEGNDCSSALLNAHCHGGRDTAAAKFGVD